MGVLRNLTLVILSILFITTVSIAILGASIKVLLYPDIYENTLDKNNAYDYIESQITEKGYLSEGVFFKDGIKPLGSRLIRNFLSYVRGDSEKLDLSLQLNNTITQFFEKRAADLPVCADGQMPIADQGVVCRPAGIDPKDLVKMALETQKVVDMQQLSNVDLAQVIDPDHKVVIVREGVSIFKKVIYASVFLSAVFLLFIIFLTRKSFKIMLRWVDLDLLCVGVSLLAASYLIKLNFERMAATMVNLPIIVNILKDIIFAVLDTTIFYCGIIIGAGIVLLIFSFLIKGKQKSDDKQTSKK